MARLRGDLAEDQIGIAVQYPGVSGNIAFELPIHLISVSLRLFRRFRVSLRVLD